MPIADWLPYLPPLYNNIGFEVSVLSNSLRIITSGSSEVFNKIRTSNREVVKKIGDPINGFSRFTLIGRNSSAVICDRCDVIDANIPSRGEINLQEYPADLHVCVSRERKRLQVKGSD